jgi:hypothetical protein
MDDAATAAMQAIEAERTAFRTETIEMSPGSMRDPTPDPSQSLRFSIQP